MNKAQVIGTYYLPQWAINFINDELEVEDERDMSVSDWIEELEIANPKAVIVNDSPKRTHSALFVGTNEPSFEVIITGLPCNTHKVKSFYALLGKDEFFAALDAGKSGLTLDFGRWGKGLEEDIQQTFPVESDLKKLVEWMVFGSPIRQVWASLVLQDYVDAKGKTNE